MAVGDQVVYVGPEIVFRGLRGTLLETEDAATHERRLYFQPESTGIKALPCRPDDVHVVENAV
jgi:hypothetical protein